MVSLNFFISNQSLDFPTAEITMEINKEKFFNKKIITGTQHNWESIILENVTLGPHTLLVEEIQTNKTFSEVLDVSSELWIIVTFHGPKTGLKIDIRRNPVAFM
jgi:hypothetical protein